MNTTGRKGSPYFIVVIIFVLTVLVAGVLVFGDKVVPPFLLGKAALSAESLYGSASVSLDGKVQGNTPFRFEDVSSKEHTVKLSNDTNSYEVSLKFIPNTEVVVNRDLGVSDVFSSGQNFWIEKNGSEAVLSVISEPANATVYIDNTEVGSTPYSASSLSEGEYDLRVSSPGYEVQNVRMHIENGYKLNVSFDLFPLPTPPKVEEFEGSEGFYNVITDNFAVSSDTQDWVDAVIYWNETRGVNLSGLGLNKEKVFNYFIDLKGNVYDGAGVLLGDNLSSLEDAEKGAYLARISDPEGLSPEAKEAYQKLTGSVVSVSVGKTATITETGLGWLRVRSSASLNSTELGRATVGEMYAVLEEGSGWVKIQLDDATQGWVSADYVELSE